MNLLELAQRLTSLRIDKRMTLEDVANQAGLSRGWLSKVENFRVTPSLPALASIAKVYGITMSELLDGLDAKPSVVIVRKDQRKILCRDESISKLKYEALAHNRPDRCMDPFLITVPAEDNRPQLPHSGEEFIYVLEGRVSLEYGEEAFDLNVGDSIYFDAETPHRVVCSEASPAKILSVFQDRVQIHDSDQSLTEERAEPLSARVLVNSRLVSHEA